MRKAVVYTLIGSLGLTLCLWQYAGILSALPQGFSYEFIQGQNPPNPSDLGGPGAAVPGSKNSKQAFPIYPYFQIPRNFGYHIGDEIPLTLIIEAKKGTILDLVNLPHKGEAHGPFEIRNLKIHTEEAPDTRVYKIDFNLQTFKPVLAVDSVEFPPLDILYTTSEEKSPLSGEYKYKSLLSPPYTISFSRTAAYFSDMKGIKGVVNQGYGDLVWGPILLGAVLWVGTALLWTRHWYRVWMAKIPPKRALTPEEKALEILTGAWEQHIVRGGRIKDLFSTASLAFREYLGTVYHIPATVKTFLQLKEALQGKPYQVEILEVLEKCHVILYEGYIPGRREQEETVKQLKTLVEQITTASKWDQEARKRGDLGDQKYPDAPPREDMEHPRHEDMEKGAPFPIEVSPRLPVTVSQDGTSK